MGGMITRPVFWIMSLAMWSLVLPLIIGAYNGIFLNTVDAAEVQSERFDVLMPAEGYADAESAWQARTANLAFSTGGTAAATVLTTAYGVGQDGDGCKILAVTAVGDVFYSASGTELTTSSVTGGITGCTWMAKTPIFGVFTVLVKLLLQVLALAGPLGFMLALAYFGNLMATAGSGHPLLQIVFVVLTVLVGALLVNIILPYIANVFHAIDGDRYTVYKIGGLGLIATLLKNFFGVIFLAGIVTAAWTLVGKIQGGAGGGAPMSMGSRGGM